jgi:hypothetical protein
MINNIGIRKRNIPLEIQYSMKLVMVNGSPGIVQGCRYPWFKLYPCTKTNKTIDIKDQNLNFCELNVDNIEN